MVRNYLLLAVRNLKKRKLYSFINIFGLAVGVAVCLVILMYVDFELSYDGFHKHADRIYRVLSVNYRQGEFRGAYTVSEYKLGPTLADEIPEVKAYVRTHAMYSGAVISNYDHAGEPLRFHETNIQFADSTFLDVFTYDVLQGDGATALDRPASMVITRSMADKYFGKGSNPVGRTLQVSGGWSDGDHEITAVIKDVPQNTHLNFDFLINIHNLLQNNQYRQDDGWGWSNFITYVQLHENADLESVTAKLPALVEKHRGGNLAESNSSLEWRFQPIRDIHLTKGLELEPGPVTSPGTIYFFIVISIFILAIAWVNYINLSTARAMERAREVGVKKAIGAYKSQLVTQFFFESVLVNLAGVALALLMAMALLPLLSVLVEKNFSFNMADPRLWGILLILFIAGSLISGAYPAFVLSSFRTTTVLKGSAEKAGGGLSLRKALVVFQFASSLILIAGTFAVYRQLMFMRTKDKGLNMEQMLVVNGPSVMSEDDWKMFDERLRTFKNELRKYPSVLQVASSGTVPGAGYNWGTGMRKDGTPQEEDKGGSLTRVDPDFIDTYGIALASGRTWNPESASDMDAVLINEAAVTTFGLGNAEQALNERLILGSSDTVAILGVLKNYHWNSLHSEHTPFLLAPTKSAGRYFSVHVAAGHLPQAIQQVEEQYKASFPGNPFNYFFLDEFFDQQYKSDQQFGKIFSLFAVLAILIACLGLWGLASFTTTQKLREISIRKVMGASVRSIVSLLSGQFVRLVIIASFIAFPAAWYGIDSWLDGFAFRIGLEWELFVVPVFVLAVISLSTVSLQILRGANTNPASVLRSE